jgi:lactate dehydrogenase-like 2-hydroxyacid dehydrogenase
MSTRSGEVESKSVLPMCLKAGVVGANRSPSLSAPNDITNMPINTTHQITNGSIGSLAKPKVYSLNPLRSKALKLARNSFDLILPSDDNAEAWRHNADGLLVVGGHVTEEDLEQVGKTGRLRYISKQGAGVDKIHIPTAKKHGIAVMNTPGVNAQAVAELAFGMMITYVTILRFNRYL